MDALLDCGICLLQKSLCSYALLTGDWDNRVAGSWLARTVGVLFTRIQWEKDTGEYPVAPSLRLTKKRPKVGIRARRAPIGYNGESTATWSQATWPCSAVLDDIYPTTTRRVRLMEFLGRSQRRSPSHKASERKYIPYYVATISSKKTRVRAPWREPVDAIYGCIPRRKQELVDMNAQPARLSG